MRIVVHGQQAFGKAVLEALLKRGENVVGVYVAPEKPGQTARPAEGSGARGQAAGLTSRPPIASPRCGRSSRALKPDLQVMAFVTLFVPEEFLNIPTHGSIQYHPSLLPAYRGASAINWPIILGEKETGLSIFWPDNGLDTGAVLLQKKTPIGPKDTLGTVYFDRLFPMGVEAMLESVDLVKAGKAPRIKQDEAQATYEGRCTTDIARIDWGKSWRQIDPLIRGCNPAPGAWTMLDGKTLQIFDIQPLPARDPKGIAGKLGEVVEVTADGFTVVCADGRIKVLRVKPADGPKVGAGEWAAAANLDGRHAARLSDVPNRLYADLTLRSAAKGASRRVGNRQDCSPPFETPRCARLLRVRWWFRTIGGNRRCPRHSTQIRSPTSRSPRRPRSGRSWNWRARSSASRRRTSSPTATTRPRSRWTTSSRCRASPTAS